MKNLERFKSTRLAQIMNKTRNLQSHPYRIFRINPSGYSSISDLFVGRNGDFKTIFRAENTLALMAGELIPVRHLLTYFDEGGRIVLSENFETDSFIYDLELSKDVPDIFSFTHHTTYSKDSKLLLSDDLSALYRQHRGYTGFKYLDQPFYNFVHGNWGALYISNRGSIRSLSRQTSQHTYTIQEKFVNSFDYDIIIQNPTEKNLDVQIYGVDIHGFEKDQLNLSIPKFGFFSFRPRDIHPIVSICSDFSVLRPYVFETSKRLKTCNVFHA